VLERFDGGVHDPEAESGGEQVPSLYGVADPHLEVIEGDSAPTSRHFH
jgi:hypothetical protein